MVRVDDAPATVCMCTELCAIITVQLHVGLCFKYKYTALYNLLLYERQAWLGFISSKKVHIRRRSHVLLYHCIIYCAAVYCIELSMYHYILKCKAEKLYMYSACFTFLSPELCASFREIQILTGLIPAAVYWFPLYRLALVNLLDHST